MEPPFVVETIAKGSASGNGAGASDGDEAANENGDAEPALSDRPEEGVERRRKITNEIPQACREKGHQRRSRESHCARSV